MFRKLLARTAGGLRVLVATVLVLLSPVQSRAQSSGAVALELVMLIDVSASVNEEEFRLQAHGLATAFRSQTVRDAIEHSLGAIAVTVIQWADGENQRMSIDWTLIGNGTDATWLAGQLASMPRLIHSGHTALGNALEVALAALENNGYEGARRVIDLSGDGRTNDGRPLRGARAEVLEQGVIINGLAILNELPLLADYFRDNLIGGESAFVMTADDYVDFARAMTEKLAREIQNQPVTENTTPTATRQAGATDDR